MKTPEYERCIVGFIDILGFRNLIKERSASDVYNAINLLIRVTNPVENADRENMTLLHDSGMVNPIYCQSVSDAIVRVVVFDPEPNPDIGFRPNTDALFYEVEDLLLAQVSLIEKGILVRGGVTIGHVCIDRESNGPIFGPGMVRAFEIEDEETVFPRIVIDEELLKEFHTNPKLTQYEPDQEATKELYSFLRTGEDGLTFIDYLGAAHICFPNFVEYLLFLDRHAQLLRKKLGESLDRKTRRKYIWLKNYQNDVVTRWRKEAKSNSNFYQEYKILCVTNVMNHLDRLAVA